MLNVGIRKEDKYEQERRVAITPLHAKRIMEKHNIAFHVEKSPKRAFSDHEFEEAGCKLSENVNEPKTIFGIKEIPIYSKYSSRQNVCYFFSCH